MFSTQTTAWPVHMSFSHKSASSSVINDVPQTAPGVSCLYTDLQTVFSAVCSSGRPIWVFSTTDADIESQLMASVSC